MDTNGHELRGFIRLHTRFTDLNVGKRRSQEERTQGRARNTEVSGPLCSLAISMIAVCEGRVAVRIAGATLLKRSKSQ